MWGAFPRCGFDQHDFHSDLHPPNACLSLGGRVPGYSVPTRPDTTLCGGPKDRGWQPRLAGCASILQDLCTLCPSFSPGPLNTENTLSSHVELSKGRPSSPAPPGAKGHFLLPLCFMQVQIDPYLEDSLCHICSSQPGPFFCRDQVSPLGS